MSDLISRQKAKDAIDMALDHIDHVPPWVYDNLLNALNEVPSVKPTHSTPSNTLGALDCVSRQDAIDACTDRHGICIAKQRLLELPSVQPRTGKWLKDRDNIYHCSCCGTDYLMYDAVVQDTHYCPNCGCRIEEGDSDEVN